MKVGGVVAVVLLAAGVAPAPAQPGPVISAPRDCLTIEAFARATVGEFPADWTPRKDAGKAVYRVLEEQGLRFLRAVSKGLGVQAAKAFEWDLAAFPWLSWSWRPSEFPKGGDERDAGTNDSVLAVYMLVPYSRITGPKAMKYVWSEKVDVDTHLNSNYGLTQVLVLRSGLAGKDEWADQKVNALEDYKKFFGESDTPRPAGIAVLTDSDDTKSSAVGDYANFRACRS